MFRTVVALILWMLAPAAWAACSEDADCGPGEVCDLGACVPVATPEAAPEEPPLAVPLQQEPTPDAPPGLHPGLSYAESAWNVALRNEIETWILFGLTAYGGLTLVSNITLQDPRWATLELLGSGGLVTYGIVTSWKAAKAGRAGLGRLGISAHGSLLEQVAWGGYAASLASGAVAIVCVWAGQYQLAQATTGVAVIAAVGSIAVMQVESILTRRTLADAMDKLDPSRISLAPMVTPIRGGATFGFVGAF